MRAEKGDFCYKLQANRTSNFITQTSRQTVRVAGKTPHCLQSKLYPNGSTSTLPASPIRLTRLSHLRIAIRTYPPSAGSLLPSCVTDLRLPVSPSQSYRYSDIITVLQFQHNTVIIAVLH